MNDLVYLKVSPMKCVKRYNKKGKISPQYSVHYKISKRIVNVSYELQLSTQLAIVHPVFHIYLLKKCIGIKDNISYEEIHVDILNCRVRMLRTKEVASVKVLWRNQFF